MLSLKSLWITEVHLDMIVIPRSFSMSLESIALSSEKETPVCLSKQSTRVVFP